MATLGSPIGGNTPAQRGLTSVATGLPVGYGVGTQPQYPAVVGASSAAPPTPPPPPTESASGQETQYTPSYAFNPQTNTYDLSETPSTSGYDLGQEEFAANQSELSNIQPGINNALGSLESLASGSGSVPGTQGFVTAAAPGATPTQTLPSMTAAANAEMTAAKEQAGQTLVGGEKSLENALAARGLATSGMATAGLSSLISQAGSAEDQAQAQIAGQGLSEEEQAAANDQAAAEKTQALGAEYNESEAAAQNQYNQQQVQNAMQYRTAAVSQLTDLLKAAGALY